MLRVGFVQIQEESKYGLHNGGTVGRPELMSCHEPVSVSSTLLVILCMQRRCEERSDSNEGFIQHKHPCGIRGSDQTV